MDAQHVLTWENAMKQKRRRQNPFRRLAEFEVHAIFGDNLSAKVEGELTTSLVRQWTCYDGHAGLLADQVRFWWNIKKTASGYDIGRSWSSGCILDPFVQERGIDPAEVPLLLHRLNVSQSAEVGTVSGERLRFFMKPKERCIGVEVLAGSTSEP
jgi:hypothetical protein